MNFLKGLLITCLIFLQACHYKILKDTQVEPTNGSQAAAQIDFAFVMQEVIGPKCLECHSSGSGLLNLETYASVAANKDLIKDAIADDYMPKRRAPLTPAQKQILNSWIDAGAPETVSIDPAPKPQPEPLPEEPVPPTPVPTPVEPNKDWLTVKTLVIDPACLRCHSSPANRGNINLETYQNTLADISLVQQAIENGSMPARGTLTPEQKKLILDWIQIGAPEFANP
jgi:uncharacterized membrane protein